MAWEQRGGRRYYYRKERVGGRVRSVYVPESAAGLYGGLRAHNQAVNAEVRRAISEGRAEDVRLGEACRSLRGLARALMLAAGFHEHKRQWRRRRMSKSIEGAGGLTREAFEEIELMAQAMSSDDPSRAAKELVARELAIQGMWRISGDFMGAALKDAARAFSRNYITAESVQRGLEEMKAELGFESSSLPERLLIEQVLLCWLRLSRLEQEQNRAERGGQPYAYLHYLQTATTQAQRRYTNAISSLARVRRLLRPRGPLFQVNVLAVAGETPARAAVVTVEAEEVRQLGGLTL